LSWTKVSDLVKAEMKTIGDCVADRLWELDNELAALLDEQ
jgi:hypothetical protein